jgi:hypothetical protein
MYSDNSLSTKQKTIIKEEKNQKSDAESSMAKSKRRSDISDLSNMKTQIYEKSTIVVDQSTDNKERERKKSKPTLNRSKTKSESNKKSRKKVTFKERNFLDIVNVESYKKYNANMSFNEPGSEETTRCRCLIF